MIIIGRRTLGVIVLVCLFGVGFFSIRYLNRPRIRMGDHYLTINYRAKINPKKNYYLKLWDYKWPGPEGDTWYQPFIKEAIKDFETKNPNIKVELNLLDFKEGRNEFSKALASGVAPDVYCSVYDIPEFNYRWQIPVAIFLRPEELNVFYPGLRKLVTLNSYQLTFPRWSAPGIWIGNRGLMEGAGLSVEKIQKQGWSWRDLTKLKEKSAPVCIGNYSANGLFPQLLAITGNNQSQSDINRTLDIISFINGPLPQKIDFEANMFQHFISGKVMFLGGVRPLVYDFIKRKATESGIEWEPVLLPFPSEAPGKIIMPVESGVVGVYRHRKTRGDDHLAAAVRLAYFISTYRATAPWQRLKVIPALPALAKEWARGPTWATQSELLTDWFNKAELFNLKVCPDYQGSVYPELKKFLSGKIKREELESIILKNCLIREK